MLRNAFLLACSIRVFCASTSHAAACDLQMPHQNPKDVSGLVMSKRAADANLIISADADRLYDLVDTVDGLTFGFGNWPQQEAAAFFSDMATANGGKALSSLEGCLDGFFSMAEGRSAWNKLEQTAKIPPTPATPKAVDAALKKTVLSSTWMKRYSKHCLIKCEPGEPDFYHEQQGWFPASMQYALRDENVVQWQVDYWDRTIVASGAAMAAKAGMRDDEPAIVGFTAYASSSPGWATDVVAAARSDGKLAFGHYVWSWSKPPAGAPADATGMAHWHQAIIWQYYVEHTREEQLKRRPTWEFRGRSRAFYDMYLKTYWALPAVGANGQPDWKSEKNLDPALIKSKM